MVKYDSYKDSGVKWIRKIPSNWSESRIRMVGDLYGGLTGKKGNDFNDEDNPSNKPFIPFTNIFNNTYISRDHFQYVNIGEEENQNRVLKNDLFFLMSSESYEDLGKCSILLEDVDELYLNSFCKGYRIKNKRVYPLFLNYQLLGSLHKEMISIEGNGFTRINLRQDRLLDIPVFIPPYDEQQQIVEFVDTKTLLIDSLIEKTQKKIELLKEQRTSLINQVVTKGLNSNVEMKDSGVEWIGEIPSHWELTKVKYEFDISGGGTPSKDKSEYWGGDIPWVSPKDMKIKDIFSTEDYVTIEGIENSSTKLISETSLLMVVRSGILQHTLPVSFNTVPVTINQDLKSFIPTGNLNVSYFYYLIKGNEKNLLLEWSKEGTTVESIETEFLLNSKLPIPQKMSEQQQIVEYLDEKTELIDSTMTNEKKRIKLLKEYRQSLISEVVTGKIKVSIN